jgi:hypothetical protein
MDTTVKHTKGRVTDITCNQCQKLVPFIQPELSTDPAEATVMSHSCPLQILTDKQEALAKAQAAETATTNTSE